MWVSARFPDAILRNDDLYIRVAEILPLSFHLLVFTFQFVCGAGIIFNTRRVICCRVVDGALGGVVVCCVYAISPEEDKRLQCAATKLITIYGI